jgi:pimeloyl-ACP methyl ester carboxylesterase
MKLFIQNRDNKKIAVILEQNLNQKGLAFVMHGLGGLKEQPHIETFAQIFKDNGFTVVRFDTTHTYGESEGNYEDATTTNYYQDLEDVIKWAKTQDFYQEPFVLVGHSLGGISTALYAENHPKEVKALAPISTVVSGKLSTETYNKEDLDNWKSSGIKITPSSSKPGLTKRLKYTEFEDRLKYDLIPNANKLVMPVLMIVGSEDDKTPEKHQRILYNALPGKKEFHVIQGAPHTFKDPKHLQEIKDIFDKWIKEVL